MAPEQGDRAQLSGGLAAGTLREPDRAERVVAVEQRGAGDLEVLGPEALDALSLVCVNARTDHHHIGGGRTGGLPRVAKSANR